VLGAGASVVIVSYALATRAAVEVTRPVEKKIDDHLIDMKGKQELMSMWVAQDKERRAEDAKSRAELNAKLNALCRASARPQVCLGGE
jgi:hypothetical protein